jgi:hypothetical protein
MNKHTHTDPLAELAILRQRLDKLEAEHGDFQRNASRRPVVPRKFLLTALAVVLVLAAVGGLLGQGATSLFIDPKGNVGIGTQSPNYPLDVRGDFRVVNDDTNLQGFTGRWDEDDSCTKINSYRWTDPPGLEPLRVDGSVLSLNSEGGGNVGIGTDEPQAKLDIQQEPRTNLNNHTSDTHGVLYMTGDLGEDSGIEFRHSDGREGIGFGYHTIYATGADQDQDLNIQPRGTGKVRIAGLETTGDSVFTGNAKVSGTINGGALNTTGDATVRGLTVNGDVNVTGALKLPDGWQISSSPGGGHASLLFSRNGGERLQYDMPGGHGYYYLGWGDNQRAEWQSDARFKTDVRTISDALDKVNRLGGITYCWNQTALDYFTRDIERTISAGPDATPEANHKVWQAERARRYKELSNANVGVVAQDVEAVLPEAVSADESGYKSVRYYELIPLLIEALKEEDGISKGQSETIARQQAEIQRLTAASQLAVRQLNELREVKQKLARLEAAMSKLAGSGSSGDHNDLISSAEGSRSNPGNTLDSH